MRFLKLTALASLVAFLGFLSLAPRPAQQDPMDAAAMAEMMRLAQPGPEHEELAKYAGDWKGAVSIFMAPGTPALKQVSSASSRMILGDRFLEMKTSGDFMGQSFESVSMLGFDRRNEEWTTVGFDTLGTYWVAGAGKRNADGVLELHGRDSAPDGEQVYTFEIEFLSDDAFTSSVVFSKQGPRVYDPPFKMVETLYTRR